MIEPKEKPCKGTGLAKGYGCGKPTKYRVYGLGKMCCYADWLLNSENGKIKLEKATLKATKNSRELAEKKLERKARNSLGALIEQTQIIFNKYIRLRDKGKPCISSGIPYKDDFDAGHCFPVSTYAGLRFNEYNVHGQSVQDNRFKSGNQVDYLINLPKRIGEERFDRLLKEAENYKKNGYKFTRQELCQIQEKYKAKIKELL